LLLNECCCLFRYRLSPETSEYTLVGVHLDGNTPKLGVPLLPDNM